MRDPNRTQISPKYPVYIYSFRFQLGWLYVLDDSFWVKIFDWKEPGSLGKGNRVFWSMRREIDCWNGDEIEPFATGTSMTASLSLFIQKSEFHVLRTRKLCCTASTTAHQDGLVKSNWQKQKSHSAPISMFKLKLMIHGTQLINRLTNCLWFKLKLVYENTN